MFTDSEFAQYIGADSGEVDVARVGALRREAEVIIRAYVRRLPDDVATWPEVAKVVALRAVSRAYANAANGLPEGATSVSYGGGPFTQSIGFSESGSNSSLWLTKQDKDLLRGIGGGSSAYSVDMTPVGSRIPRSWFSTTDWW